MPVAVCLDPLFAIGLFRVSAAGQQELPVGAQDCSRQSLIEYWDSLRDVQEARGRDPMSTEAIVAVAFGIIFVVTLIVLAIQFPNPTPFQYTIFRTVLA